MAMADLQVGSPVIDIAFTNDGSAMAVLHQTGISFFPLETKGVRLLAPKSSRTIAFGEEAPFYEETRLQIAFAGQHDVLVLRSTWLGDWIATYSFDPSNNQEGSGDIEADVSSSDGVEAIFSSSYPDGIIAQNSLGKLTRHPEGTTLGKFPAFLPWASFLTQDGKFMAIGLSRSGHLYANSRQLAKNCTSFLVTPSHLIFTTSNHLVKFIHLAGTEEGLCMRLVKFRAIS